MDKFKFTDDEAVDILNAVEELIENPRFTKTDLLDRIETIISSRADSVLSSLPAPTQDGTSEENIESYWIESDDLGGGMHLMVFKSDYIRAMHRYAAPLRSEIERLKSELAASVSPKLVLPKGKRLSNPSRIEGTYEEGFNGCLYELRRLNPHIADCLDTKQEKRYKMPLSAEFEEEKYFTKVKMPYGTFNSDK